MDRVPFNKALNKDRAPFNTKALKNHLKPQFETITEYYWNHLKPQLKKLETIIGFTWIHLDSLEFTWACPKKPLRRVPLESLKINSDVLEQPWPKTL